MNDEQPTAEENVFPPGTTEEEIARTRELVTGRRAELMPVAPVVPASLTVKPRVKSSELVERLDVIEGAMKDAMKDGLDYGVIPGTSKPTLLKPGAEKLGVLFELDIQLQNEKLWEPPHLTIVSKATVFHAPSGARLGYGEGICSTHEAKYAKRRANRRCPDCGAEAILKSKDEGGGWFCWRKRDGCGNQFVADDDRITRQEVGEIDNPNLPDTWNTVVKIAEKRARVDAVLAVTGASALFTQDAEDQSPEDRSQDAGAGSEQMKRGGSKPDPGEAITKGQKGAITRAINEKIPEERREEFRAKLDAKVKTKKQAGAFIGLMKTNPDVVYQRLGFAPKSDVPADTTELDAAEREEAEAIAAAQGEEGDAFGLAGSDETS